MKERKLPVKERKLAREEGIQNEKIKIAKNLLSIGMSIVDIVKVTGLKAGEIENLR
jgi:predicted transposase YdaD